MNEGSDVDPLDWLDNRSSEPSVRVRESILAQTQRVLRRRRALRRCVRLACFAVVYLAGLASMDVWRIVVRGEGVNQDAALAHERNEQLTSDGNRVAASTSGLPAPATEPSRPERPAKTQFEIARDAADRALKASGDIALATRLYARALRHASPAELALSVDDNWLLMSLKEARIQEMKHAHDKLKS